MKHLAITVRFLGDRFHGRTENGHRPEWPPSPLRLYQAIVAGAAQRWHDIALRKREFSALRWFEGLHPPRILAPRSEWGQALLTYVPENISDKNYNTRNVKSCGIPEKRDAKILRPTVFRGEPKIIYYWSVDARDEELALIVINCARHCYALGWGIDMVIADGAILETAAVSADLEEWLPTEGFSENVALRVPRKENDFGPAGTLWELTSRFDASLKRLGNDGRSSPPPLRAYRTVGYRRATDPPARPFAVFSLLKPDASGFRPFDTARRGLTVAGMLRHAAKMAAASSGWAVAEINSVILGHGEADDGSPHVPVQARFAYLPLPTIEPRGEGRASVIGAIRRVMISAFALQQSDRIGWARRTLSGQELIEERAGDDRSVAILSLLPQSDSVVRRYINSAATWSTVTPVVLPGYDDPAHYRRRMSQPIAAAEQKTLLARLADRIDRLLRKAIVQAGFPSVLAENAILEWRETGFWPGVDRVDRYGVPDHLQRFPRLHVRVQWRDTHQRPLNIPGPICLGGGRFYGLGLFAAL